MTPKNLLFLLPLLLVTAAAALHLGQKRWQRRTDTLRERLEAARRPIEPKVFDLREIANLPAPVQRFFRMALMDGQPMIAAVTVAHTGGFNQSETAAHWQPFTSHQRVVVHRPGFVWDARIRMWGGLPVRVYDAYVAGEGMLKVALPGLFSLANRRDAGEMAKGELIRFLAEGAWYPTALLPSQGIRWQAVDERSARATLTDGELSITLLFRFNDEGLIDTVQADARGWKPGVSLPWQARLWNYTVWDNLRVPLEGEAAWLTPAGLKPYWRARITKIGYEYAR
jgi:hypothetical protein